MSTATDVINPATEKVIAEVPVRGVEETDEAVAQGSRPQVRPGGRWPRLTGPGCHASVRGHGGGARRGARPAGDGQRGQADHREPRRSGHGGGGPRLLRRGDRQAPGATVPVAGGVDMTFHEPLGVVGAIIPWNFP